MRNRDRISRIGSEGKGFSDITDTLLPHQFGRQRERKSTHMPSLIRFPQLIDKSARQTPYPHQEVIHHLTCSIVAMIVANRARAKPVARGTPTETSDNTHHATTTFDRPPSYIPTTAPSTPTLMRELPTDMVLRMSLQERIGRPTQAVSRISEWSPILFF